MSIIPKIFFHVLYRILNQHKSHRTLPSATPNTGLHPHTILYTWTLPRHLPFHQIPDKIPTDKHIYNNNQSLNVQNTRCKSTTPLPDSTSVTPNPRTIADHLAHLNKNPLFSAYPAGNYKKYTKNNQYHRNTSPNTHINQYQASGLYRTLFSSTGHKNMRRKGRELSTEVKELMISLYTEDHRVNEITIIWTRHQSTVYHVTNNY